MLTCTLRWHLRKRAEILHRKSLEKLSHGTVPESRRLWMMATFVSNVDTSRKEKRVQEVFESKCTQK